MITSNIQSFVNFDQNHLPREVRRIRKCWLNDYSDKSSGGSKLIHLSMFLGTSIRMNTNEFNTKENLTVNYGFLNIAWQMETGSEILATKSSAELGTASRAVWLKNKLMSKFRMQGKSMRNGCIWTLSSNNKDSCGIVCTQRFPVALRT